MQRILFFVCACFLCGGLMRDLSAAVGDLDATFGQGGIVVTDFQGSDNRVAATVLQPDGKILVVGDTSPTAVVLARYTANGNPDPDFGSSGIVTFDQGTAIRAHDMVLLPDGKILVTGLIHWNNTFDILLIRFHPDGTLDSAFDGDGWVATDFTHDWDEGYGVQIQPDGKIVVAGHEAGDRFAVVRYLPDGALDSSFGQNGRVIKDILAGPDFGKAILIQPDGKIVAAGNAAGDFALLRLHPDGSPDSSFHFDGVAITDLSGSIDNLESIILQPDGKLLAAGGAGSSTAEDFGLARYNPDGSLDTSFDSDGIVTTDIGQSADNASDVALQPDGKIVAAGMVFPSAPSDFALARYNPDGSLDLTFHYDGIVNTAVKEDDLGKAVLLQPDGKIVVAGSTYSGNYDFAIVRYEGDPLVVEAGCLFCDDFEDGLLDSDWSYTSPTWTESAGNLIGTSTGSVAQAIATPAFEGCLPCTVRATMSTAGGMGNRVSLVAWYVNKNSMFEIIMKEESDKWILKQRAGGKTVAKTKGSAPIHAGQVYDVQIVFDGNAFNLIVDNSPIAHMLASAAPSGTVGFRVKNTTGTFGLIAVN